MSPVTLDWPTRLSPTCIERDAALVELRVLLIKGLHTGLSGRAGADEGFIEDVAQMSLVRILDHLHTFEGRSTFITWALAIALRVAFIELRRKRWNNVSLDELKERNPDLNDATDPSPDPQQQASRASLIQLMHRLIQSELTPLQRDVLLAELNGMPQDEIATQLGRTRNTIYKLGHDARRALKQAFENAGYSVADMLSVFTETSPQSHP
ncbi:MAG: sigma-70 family RNA polymerase sigma factor [Verrucomicrobia bacterium]|nr:sigma-70 family RNA polymerase sigma factor [Verrucomicrobiota bacterium]